MVSDQEIASCVESVLRQSDPAAGAASLTGVVRQVEAKLGLDLSHKAAFIRDQIELLLGPSRPSAPPHAPHHQLPASHNPYVLLHQLPLQQQIPPHQPASSAGVAAPAPFSHQHHPGVAFQYPPPPPLPAAAVVAAYHLQQQLHQAPQGATAVVRPAPVTGAVGAPKERCLLHLELKEEVALEDSSNTSILCDSKLQELFGCESLPIAGISDMLANHLFKKS
ncbi:hypothetical protein BHE74_00009318 [Ensete ventricosum]|uniref:DEK-C domain-containing protein n=1 Tax=Ensete ventricosum TaxID=4639 RepID=A0A445MDJ0_ENSVE|nr:hypothetical protein BHE74_00009318 [Ensete ventricosum]RZR72311.1 hypothetical protein BHM03_00012326 [Ensete ventricosum]